jgi:hypothetical protein
VRAEGGRQLAELGECHFSAFHMGHVGGWRALSEPLDESMNGGGLTNGKHLDATVRKIVRVAATAKLLRTLPRRGAIENALHAPGYETAPCDER